MVTSLTVKEYSIKEYDKIFKFLERRIELVAIIGQDKMDYPKLSKAEIDEALKTVKEGLDKRYHFLDVIIKVCVDYKIVPGMYNYTQLWKIMKKEGLLNDVKIAKKFCYFFSRTKNEHGGFNIYL